VSTADEKMEKTRRESGRLASLLLLAATAAAIVHAARVLSQPQQWIPVSQDWMRSMPVQGAMNALLGTIRVVWAAGWLLLGSEADRFVLRGFKKRSLPPDTMSFLALWLFVYLGIPWILSRLFPYGSNTLLRDFHYLAAPVAVVVALIGHGVLVGLLDRGHEYAARSFTLILPLSIASLAWIFVKARWLPVLLSTATLVWTLVIWGAALVVLILFRWVDSRRLERTIGGILNRSPGSPWIWAVSLIAVLMLPPVVLTLRAKPGVAPGAQNPLNVLLITIDTLRADHLRTFGYDLPTSSSLDALAGDAVVFTHCISTAPQTVPAVVSIMTSQYPSYHTAGTSNGGRSVLSSELTLARVMSDNGYRTAAFVGNWVLSRKLKLYGGFDVYDDTFTSFERVRGVPERDARSTNRYVLNWLEGAANGPFFLWVHYQDPHGPYVPPQRYLRDFPGIAYDHGSDRLQVTDNYGWGGIPEYQYQQGHTQRSYYERRYDAEIAYADEMVGELLARVKELGLWEDTIVILTADHGESMGEHEYFYCHGQDLTEELLRVPLLLRVPGATSAERISEPVSLIDVAPTVLAAVGRPEDLGAGLSLLALAEGRAGRLNRDYVIAEDDHGRVCFHTGAMKYIDGPDGERMYDLRQDACEATNLLEESPFLAEQWRTICLDYRNHTPLRKGESVHFSPADLEKLKSLGYVN